MSEQNQNIYETLAYKEGQEYAFTAPRLSYYLHNPYLVQGSSEESFKQRAWELGFVSAYGKKPPDVSLQ